MRTAIGLSILRLALLAMCLGACAHARVKPDAPISLTEQQQLEQDVETARRWMGFPKRVGPGDTFDIDTEPITPATIRVRAYPGRSCFVVTDQGTLEPEDCK